jgi:hypothetical protein
MIDSLEERKSQRKISRGAIEHPIANLSISKMPQGLNFAVSRSEVLTKL